MNLYSSTLFLETVADLGFPGQPREIEVVRLGKERYRLLVVGGRQVVTQWPYMDFFEPLAEDEPGLPTRTVGWLPVASVAYLPAEEWKREAYAPEYQPSPTIEWGRFEKWEDFQALVQKRIASRLADSARKRRKLEREMGPVRFTLHDERREVFDTCLRWKSSQYVASGYKDLFSESRNVELFRRLAEGGMVKVSSLYAGETLLAVHLGAVHEGRCYWWVPAYDPGLSRFSPGRLLLEDLMESSYRQGHREFDFLIGEEDYKWHYATHTRVAGPVGEPPLRLRLEKAAKERMKPVLQRYPWVWEKAQELKRRLR